MKQILPYMIQKKKKPRTIRYEVLVFIMALTYCDVCRESPGGFPDLTCC